MYHYQFQSVLTRSIYSVLHPKYRLHKPLKRMILICIYESPSDASKQYRVSTEYAFQSSFCSTFYWLVRHEHGRHHETIFTLVASKFSSLSAYRKMKSIRPKTPELRLTNRVHVHWTLGQAGWTFWRLREWADWPDQWTLWRLWYSREGGRLGAVVVRGLRGTIPPKILFSTHQFCACMLSYLNLGPI